MSTYDEIVREGFCYKYQCETCHQPHRYPGCYRGRHACYQCWKNGLDSQRHGCYTKKDGLCPYRSMNFEHFRPRESSTEGFGYIHNDDGGHGEGDNFKSLFLEPAEMVMKGPRGTVPQDRGTSAHPLWSGSTVFQTRGNLGTVVTSGPKFVFRPDLQTHRNPGPSQNHDGSYTGPHRPGSTQSGPSLKRPHLDEYTEQSFNDRELLIKENTELKGRLELQKERNKNREDNIMQQAEVELRKVRAERDRIKEEVGELRKTTKQVQTERDVTKEEVNGLREDNDRLLRENAGLREESDGLRRETAGLQQKFGAAERDIIKYRQLAHNLQGQVISQKEEFQAAITKLSRPRNGQAQFINAFNSNPNAGNSRDSNVNQRNGIYPLNTFNGNPF